MKWIDSQIFPDIGDFTSLEDIRAQVEKDDLVYVYVKNFESNAT